MDSEHKMEMTKSPMVDTEDPVDYEVATVIHIDPEKEAAAIRKFDIFLLPVSVIFLVLSTLDRNNVSSGSICPLNFTLSDSSLARECCSVWL